MIFWISVFLILVVSFLWAFFNLQSELTRTKHLKKIHALKKSSVEKQKLSKEKVLFERGSTQAG